MYLLYFFTIRMNMIVLLIQVIYIHLIKIDEDNAICFKFIITPSLPNLKGKRKKNKIISVEMLVER